MIAPALRQLMRLQLRAVLRRGLRQARTPRGAIFFAVGVGVILLWLLPAVLTAKMGGSTPPEYVRLVMPLILLGVTLLTTFTAAGEKAIAFTGGEVDFLFPGPFTRRQLLLYKLFKGTAVAALTALIASVAVYRHATYWVASYVGCFLALLFVQFASTATLLAAQRFGGHARGRGKLLAGAAVAGLAVLAVRAAVGDRGYEALLTDPMDVLRQVADTPAGRVLLAPFTVLTRAFTAERLWPDLPLWGLLGLAMNLLLVGLIVRLDAFFLELAAGASDRRYERLRRARSGGAMAAVAAATARRSLPALPRLGGAGPVVWRQLTHAVRAGRGLLLVLLILAVSLGPAMVGAARARNPTMVLVAVFSILAWMSIILVGVLRFDFRSDLDAIETLKAMPLRPAAVAAGQTVVPAVAMTLIHWLVIAATLAVTWNLRVGPAVRAPLLVAAAVALPFNALMSAAENLIFLLAPTRPAAAGPGDLSMLGRQVFTLVIRTAGVGLAAGLAAALATVAYVLLGHSLTAAAVVAVAVLAVEVAAALPLVALAYARFDPSVHMPG